MRNSTVNDYVHSANELSKRGVAKKVGAQNYCIYKESNEAFDSTAMGVERRP